MTDYERIRKGSELLYHVVDLTSDNLSGKAFFVQKPNSMTYYAFDLGGSVLCQLDYDLRKR
jgi:hypothetical protein